VSHRPGGGGFGALPHPPTAQDHIEQRDEEHRYDTTLFVGRTATSMGRGPVWAALSSFVVPLAPEEPDEQEGRDERRSESGRAVPDHPVR
jgi:hypothetical protein